MCHPYGGGCLIDMLAARTGRTEIIDTHVFHIKLDLHVFRFGKHGNSCRRCMYTAARFRYGYALYTMNARFIF